MPLLEFQCSEPQIRFHERFSVGGKAESLKWSCDDRIDRGADLTGFEISWSVISSPSVFDSYAISQANRGEPICSRIPNFADYWGEAKGMIKRYSSTGIHIILSAPPTSGFEAFMTGIVASRLKLRILTPDICFAEIESAPSPTIRAFLEDFEPAFFGNYSNSESNYSVFAPFRE